MRQLSQTKGVQDYIDRFQTLVLQIPDMSAAEQLDRFTAGLKPAVQERVEIEACDTLAKAMRIAQRIDTIHHRHQQLARAAAPAQSPPAISDGPTPMELGAMRPQHSRPGMQQHSRPRQRSRGWQPRQSGLTAQEA